jgi:hypothetical protein
VSASVVDPLLWFPDLLRPHSSPLVCLMAASPPAAYYPATSPFSNPGTSSDGDLSYQAQAEAAAVSVAVAVVVEVFHTTVAAPAASPVSLAAARCLV